MPRDTLPHIKLQPQLFRIWGARQDCYFPRFYLWSSASWTHRWWVTTIWQKWNKVSVESWVGRFVFFYWVRAGRRSIKRQINLVFFCLIMQSHSQCILCSSKLVNNDVFFSWFQSFFFIPSVIPVIHWNRESMMLLFFNYSSFAGLNRWKYLI